MLHKNALILLLLFFFQNSWCNKDTVGVCIEKISVDSISCDGLGYSEIDITAFHENRPSPLLKLFRVKQKNNKKVIATLLAFPFPFGIVGLHRIYLGCTPYVPVAYIASLGGVFGILPFIDFCVLLAAKKTDTYVNNEKIFMWVN